MYGPAFEAAEYAIASFEAKLDAKIGRGLRLALGRYLGVVAIGLPVAWVVCDFKWTRDGFIGIAAGVALFALLEPLKRRKDPRSLPVAGLDGSDLDIDDASGALDGHRSGDRAGRDTRAIDRRDRAP
jgi:hypothetical protein